MAKSERKGAKLGVGVKVQLFFKKFKIRMKGKICMVKHLPLWHLAYGYRCAYAVSLQGNTYLLNSRRLITTCPN